MRPLLPIYLHLYEYIYWRYGERDAKRETETKKENIYKKQQQQQKMTQN